MNSPLVSYGLLIRKSAKREAVLAWTRPGMWYWTEVAFVLACGMAYLIMGWFVGVIISRERPDLIFIESLVLSATTIGIALLAAYAAYLRHRERRGSQHDLVEALH